MTRLVELTLTDRETNSLLTLIAVEKCRYNRLIETLKPDECDTLTAGFIDILKEGLKNSEILERKINDCYMFQEK